jgi:hypothetical protein
MMKRLYKGSSILGDIMTVIMRIADPDNHPQLAVSLLFWQGQVAKKFKV